MTLTRRSFLVAPAALAAATMLPTRLLAAVAAETPPLPDLSSWGNVRAQFALDPTYSHFASFFIASHPALVQAAIEGYRRAIDRNPFLVIEHGLFEGEADNVPLRVQAAIADYLGARAQDVCLTGNTTTGLALVYHGLPLKPDDEVLCTTHDHYSHHESIRLATERAGASVRKIALFDEAATASTESIIAALLKGIGPKTRVIGITWVHSSSGIRLPVREIATALRARSGPPLTLVVDGVHGIGSTDETIATMGCDYFCAGTHKWMFAPRGTGLIWANAENWAPPPPRSPCTSRWAAPASPRAFAASTTSARRAWPRTPRSRCTRRCPAIFPPDWSRSR